MCGVGSGQVEEYLESSPKGKGNRLSYPRNPRANNDFRFGLIQVLGWCLKVGTFLVSLPSGFLGGPPPSSESPSYPQFSRK